MSPPPAETQSPEPPPHRKRTFRQLVGGFIILFGRQITRFGRRVRGRRLEIETSPDRLLTKLEYFKIFREYRMCEQNLLNHRITWNLAIQGFLFATYGFCIQKLVEIPNQNTNAIDRMIRTQAIAQMEPLIWTIPIVGLLLSVCMVCGCSRSACS
jgi:hypothetical protein